MSTAKLCPGCERDMDAGELHTADCALCNLCGHVCPWGVTEYGDCGCCIGEPAPSGECCT